MCPWVGPHAPSFGRHLWGLPSRVEYLSPQGVLLPLVYGRTASLLWLELRGHSAWQATPSWTVYRLACHRLLPWLQVTFAMVPDAAWPGSDQWPWSTAPAPGPVGRPGRPSASDPWGVGSFLSLDRPTCVQCPGLLGSCSPVCPRGLLCCVCGVLGYLAPVHRCARSVCCVACAVSWGGRACVGLRVCLLLSPRSLPLPFPCSSLFACLFCSGFFFWGGAAGVRRFWCCPWVLVCAGAGAGVGVGVVRDGGRVAVALWVPCVCDGLQASGFQGVGPWGADGGWLAAVVAWRLRGWSRLLGSAWVAWPGAGARVGVFMASADGVVGSVGVAGLCGCRVCVRRRRGGLGSGTVGDAVGGGDVGDAYRGGCCRR